MHKTKKGNQWYFGLKIHAGVDKESGLISSVVVTAVNVHDLTLAADSSMSMEMVCPSTSIQAQIPFS